MSVQWRQELHVRIAVDMMSQEEMDAEMERVDRECRDAEEHLQQLRVGLERDAKLLGERQFMPPARGHVPMLDDIHR